MRHRVLLLLLPLVVMASCPCLCADRTPVTLRARDTSVQPLLRTLLEIGRCSYVIGADVPNDYIRSIAIVGVPFDVALRSLARSWRFTCTFEDRLCSVTGQGSDIPESPSRIADARQTAPSKPQPKPYYLVRGRAREPFVLRQAQDGLRTERISLGPRKVAPKVEPELIEYAGVVSRLVTPDVLDELAMRLARQVEQNPYLRQKPASEQIALAPFRVVGIDSRNVAIDLAEDLSTSMVKAGFNLVERAQLDKACAELSFQDTGLIDPATANRIGQLTGCGVIVVGSISDRGSMVVINARLVETATGRALAADRVMVRK